MKLNFNSKLVIFISCFLSIISGNAQTTCIDPDLPVLNTTATVVCPGTNVNLAIASGALNDATDWYWYSNSCGGSPVGTGLSLSVNPTTTTTYYVRGEGGCVTPGACTGQTIVVLPSVTLSLKVFIQGYYLGSGQMTPSIYYSIGSPYQPTDVDSITVELHDFANPCIVVGSYEVMLQTDGTVQVPVDCAVSGGTYYIVVKHRSSIETWSAAPVVFSGSVSYDFSAQQSNAYCDNEIDVMTEGIWSMYSGDFNQDGLINECDRTLLENDVANAVFGYFSTDLNGDGFVDALDLLLFDEILQLNIAMCSPCENAQALVVCPIIGPKTICGDGSGGTAVYSIAPVAGATQYNWTVPNGMTINGGQGSNSVTVSWTGVAAQMGIVGVICVSVPTPCGVAECCDSIKIGVAPEVNLGPDIVLCNPGDCVALASTPISNVNNYSWYTLPGFVSIPQTNASLLVCPTAPTCYALIVENMAGCKDTDTVCVSFYNPPLVSWPGLLPEQCGGDALYTLSGGLPAGGFYSGDGVSGNQFSPSLAGVGTHMLSYTYSDSCGHVTTISKTINVVNCPCKEPFCRDFDDNDLHGWTVNPAAPMVDVQITSLNSQNGPADYYLLASDLTGLSLLKAETGFNGRWCCGEFCFDYRTFDDGDPNSVLDIHPVFYLVRGDKTFRFTSSVSVTETNGWQHVCAPITNCNPPPVSSDGIWEALPGTTNTDWDPLTNHIDSIFFQIDWNGGDEIAGFDNVCFNARNLSATIAAVDCNTLCATVNGCCGPFSYIWTVPPGVVITSGAGNSCIQGNLISGDYTVIVSNTTGEVSTTTYHLDFPPVASWSQTTVELCTSDSPYALSGAQPQSGAGGSGVYSGGTFITGTAPNQYFDPSLVSPGTYSVSYTFTDTCGNTSTVSVDFVVTDCACDIFGSNYSSASGWTQIGTSINIDATVIDKVSFLNVPGSSDHRVYRNIGLLGNTWTAEFDFNPMSGSNVGVASELLCLTAGNLIPFRETPLGNFTDQDFISAGVTSPFNTPNYLVSTQITASYKDDATTPVIAGSIDIPSWNTDFFVRLERFDATSGLLSVFSDAARTIHIPGSPVCLLFPSTVQGLNTLQHTNVNQAGAGRRFTGTVDNTCIRSTRTTAELTASVLSIDDYDCHHAGCIHLDIPPTAAFTISYYYEDPLNSNNNYASPGSNTTSILCNLPAGDYTIYLTDACGTNITLTATIQNLNPLAVSAGPDLTICQGACVNLSATPIVPGVTYAWYRLPDRSLLSSSPFLSDCPPVDFCYLLIATGSTGCMDSDSVCVNVELMQLTCSGTNVTCHGGTNGSVCATASCLNPPYSISWTKNGTPIQGAQTLCLNGLTAGTYCITITPSSGAVETCCYTVTEPAQLSIDAIAFDAPTCGGLGSFSFFPSGGTPPYIITTDTCIPAAQPCIYNTSVGFSTTQVFPAHRYKIYITDANGCKDSIERIINEPLPPQISVSTVNPLCCGGFGHINVDINGGRAPFQIILSTYNAVDTTFFHAYMGYTGNYFTSPDEIPAGSYIVEVLDANNCRSSVTIEIVDPPCLELHVSTTGFNGIDCDGHISAYATGGTPFNTNAPVFHVPYDIIITQISGNSPGITFSQSGTLNSSPFYNFADQCCNGVYVITATDSNGCTVTDTLRMNCNFKLSPMAGVPSTLCIRNTEDAQVGELSPNANYGSANTQRVSRWTYQGIWKSVRSYIKFNVNAVPQNSFTGATLSLSTCPTCTPYDVHKDLSGGNPWFANPLWGNASIISGVSGPWTENTITWNNAPAPTAITDAVASLGDQTTTGLNANVSNIVQDWISSGVNNGLMIRLADDPAFPINYYHEINFAAREVGDTSLHPRLCISYNSSSVTVCAGSLVPLTAPLVPGVDYNWYTVPGFGFAGSGNVLSVIATVSQQYAVIAITPSGCSDTNYVQVNVEPIDLVCSGTNVTCNGGTDGTACATFNCMNQPYTISWTKDGNLISGAQTLCLNGLSAGTYCISIAPANGPVQTCCYIVTEPAPLLIDAVVFDAITCGGNGSFSFMPSGGKKPYVISTDPCPPFPFPCSYTTPFGFSTTGNYPAGTYTIFITDSLGCTSSVVKTISEPSPPEITVDVINPLCCGDSGRFVVHINGGTGPYTIRLLTNTLPYSVILQSYFGINGPIFFSPNAELAGTYIVDVIDANGCFDSQLITIVDPPCLELHVNTSGFNGIDCDGHISAYATGGTPFNTNSPNFHVPYNILITQIAGNSPGITFSQSGLLNSNPFYNFADQCCNGTYVITATDSNGCTISDTIRMDCNFSLSPMAGAFSTICIRDTEDAQVGELSPNANYGSSISLRVSRWTYNLNWATVRTYLKFNINNIPQNSISSATLSLSTCPDCTPFDVHKDLSSGNPWFANPPWGNASIISGVSGAWSENSITWNNAPAPNAITDAGASLGDQTTSSLNVNVTNIVQDWITSGVNNGMMIRLADDPAFPINYYHEVNFASRENLDTNIHPRLCISYYEPTVTICSGSSVPLAAPLIAGVDYKWYTVPGYALAGSGNVLSVSPLTNQLYAVIAITPSGCTDTNFVQVNVVTNVDDGDDCTSDYCLNGIVYHTRIISCTCPCTAPSTLSPNIVVNGNFSNGNTGFTSDLPYINACATNSYSVGNTARTKCANFNLIPDHTTGSGTGNDNFLIVDGRDAGTYTVWNGAVGNIVNGKTYTFSFALYPNVSNSTSLPNSIDVVLGNTVILSIPRSNLINDSWNEFCTSFTATANIQAARLKISHTISGGGLGYDYGIDDIIFKKCRTRIILDDVSISNVTCYGGFNGSITVTPTGGTSPYTYLWSNSATTATISNLSPGTYSLTVTDATGDVSTTSLDVLEADPVISTLSVTNPIQCYGGTTCIQVVGSGGTPPYSVTGTFCGYPEGTWTFTIYDSNGCDATSNVTIHQPSKLENSMSGVGANCGLANGSATAAPSGGTPPYSYQWNTVPGQSGATAVNLLPGTYTVTVTDANGCSRTDQITIGNSGGVPASPGAISGPAGVCRNQVNQVFCVPPVPGATSYLWTLPGGLTGTSTSNCITLSTSNTYAGGFICVRAINSCGISLATCMNLPVLTVKPPVPSSIIGNTTICGPGTYTFSTSVVANATVYNWSVTGSGVSIASGQGTNSITVSVPAGFGQGTVSVNAGNCVGNSGSRGIYITGVPSNSLPINGPTVVCAGTNNVSYTFGTVTGATSYVWTSNTPNMTVISQSGISCVVNFGPGFTTGNLSVNAISSCGSYTRTVIIKSVPSQPGGITGPYVNLCGAQTVSYSIAAVASATSYVWTSPAGTTILSGQGTTGISVSIPAAFAGGTVCVQAVNACGASIARCLTISALPPPPTGITGPITVCKSSTQNYSIAPIAGASSYSWSITGGAGLVSAGTSATVNFATAVSGTAILKVKGNNACGSSSPAQLSIVVNLGCRSSQTIELQNAGFAVYPNPSNGAFTLSFNAEKSSEYTLKVFDILGKAVYNDQIHAVNGENTVDIDLGNSAQGMYQLSIQNEEGETQTLRLVIE